MLNTEDGKPKLKPRPVSHLAQVAFIIYDNERMRGGIAVSRSFPSSCCLAYIVMATEAKCVMAILMDSHTTHL